MIEQPRNAFLQLYQNTCAEIPNTQCESESLPQQIRRFLAEWKEKTPNETEWENILRRLLHAAGITDIKFNASDKNINAKNFPYQPGNLNVRDVVIISLPANQMHVSGEKISKEMQDNNLRPATIIELLLWRIDHMEEQSFPWVYARGSLCKVEGFKNPLAPCISTDGGKERTDLRPDTNFRTGEVFAAVKI